MKLLEGGAGGEQVQTGGDARDVRVDGHVAPAEREQQDARGGLSTDAGKCKETIAGLLDRDLREAVE